MCSIWCWHHSKLHLEAPRVNRFRWHSAQMYKHKYTTNTGTVGGCWEEKYVTLWSHYPHMPILYRKATFLYSLCISVFMQLSERENKRACVPDTETLLFSAQAADLSTIISWIVLHAQHLSQTHKNCLFHTHKPNHYIVITVRLMLYSPH